MNLYQITKEHLELEAQLIECEGELTPELEESLQLNNENLESKAFGYATMIRKFESESEQADKEIKRIQAYKTSRENAAKRLKETLSVAMQIFNKEELKQTDAPFFKLSFRKSKAIQIFDENELPLEYWNIKEVKSPDKTKIKEAIEAQIEVPGAVQIENKNLQIK